MIRSESVQVQASQVQASWFKSRQVQMSQVKSSPGEDSLQVAEQTLGLNRQLISRSALECHENHCGTVGVRGLGLGFGFGFGFGFGVLVLVLVWFGFGVWGLRVGVGVRVTCSNPLSAVALPSSK